MHAIDPTGWKVSGPRAEVWFRWRTQRLVRSSWRALTYPSILKCYGWTWSTCSTCSGNGRRWPSRCYASRCDDWARVRCGTGRRRLRPCTGGGAAQGMPAKSGRTLLCTGWLRLFWRGPPHRYGGGSEKTCRSSTFVEVARRSRISSTVAVGRWRITSRDSAHRGLHRTAQSTTFLLRYATAPHSSTDRRRRFNSVRTGLGPRGYFVAVIKAATEDGLLGPRPRLDEDPAFAVAARDVFDRRMQSCTKGQCPTKKRRKEFCILLVEWLSISWSRRWPTEPPRRQRSTSILRIERNRTHQSDGRSSRSKRQPWTESGRWRLLLVFTSHTTGRAGRHPAVHEVRVRRWCSASRLKSPSCRNMAVGTAACMWLAPAFHHGPRPLAADARARASSRPRRRSSRYRVRGRFHCRHMTPRSFRRSHWSRSSKLALTSANRK